ncbi:MAG TPA: SDR family oxidoreductase [Burkholderiales bacterium]|nr:SDR family oxidoreductase [Burkholderiales bacterium]
MFLVTGGGRGIGASIARLAAARGHHVAILYRENDAAAAALVKEIEKAGGRALALKADVGDEKSLVRAFETVDRAGPLDVLVNNAGITGKVGRLAELPGETLEEILRINVTGAFLASREAVRRMSTKHGGRGGAIVNVSSGASRTGSPGVWIHYAASKGALDTLTIGLAKEVAAEGIRVNGVRPGLVDTDIHAGRPPGQLEQMAQRVPLGRIGQPVEIAQAVLWLASKEASYVTGAILDASGGV